MNEKLRRTKMLYNFCQAKLMMTQELNLQQESIIIILVNKHMTHYAH